MSTEVLLSSFWLAGYLLYISLSPRQRPLFAAQRHVCEWVRRNRGHV